MSDLDSLRAQATDMMQVRTANYRPPMYYRPSFNMLGLPPFTLMTVEWMKRDPQVKLGMSLKTAPFHKVRMTMKGDPEVVDFMGTQIKKFWQKAMPKIMRAFWYTMSAGEIIYKLNEQTNRYDFDNMIEFYPRDVHILHHNGIPKGIKVIPNAANGSVPVGMATDTNNTDAFSGMHEPVQLLFPKGFLYVHNAEFNSLIGQSDFEGAYDPWLEKTDYQGAKQSRKLWFFKNAFSGGMMFHPPGSYQLPSGEKIPYADIARQAMETSLNGAVWCIEQKFDPETKQPMWQYVSPQFNPGGEHLLEYVQALDTEILRGLGIPDDVISQVSGAGSFAGRTIPLMAFFISQESVLDNLFTVCDEQVFRPLCRANFGHDHYEATVDVDIESLMGMMAGADGNSGTQDGMDASLEAAQMKSEGVDVSAPGPEQMSETGEVYTHTIRQFSLSTGSDLAGKLMREIGKRIGIRRVRPSNPTIDINFNTNEEDDDGDDPLQFGEFDESKHPRGSKGTKQGGRFVSKGGGVDASVSRETMSPDQIKVAIKKTKQLLSGSKNIPDKKLRDKATATHQKRLEELEGMLKGVASPEKPAKPKPEKPVSKPKAKEPEPEPEDEPEDEPEPEPPKTKPAKKKKEKEPEPEMSEAEVIAAMHKVRKMMVDAQGIPNKKLREEVIEAHKNRLIELENALTAVRNKHPTVKNDHKVTTKDLDGLRESLSKATDEKSRTEVAYAFIKKHSRPLPRGRYGHVTPNERSVDEHNMLTLEESGTEVIWPTVDDITVASTYLPELTSSVLKLGLSHTKQLIITSHEYVGAPRLRAIYGYGVSALGCADVVSRNTSLFIGPLAGQAPSSRLDTLVHESGHQIAYREWMNAVPAKDSQFAKAHEVEKPVSAYGATKISEDFAEAWMMFGRGKLAKENPEKYSDPYNLEKNFPKKYAAISALYEKYKDEDYETARKHWGFKL